MGLLLAITTPVGDTRTTGQAPQFEPKIKLPEASTAIPTGRVRPVAKTSASKPTGTLMPGTENGCSVCAPESAASARTNTREKELVDASRFKSNRERSMAISDMDVSFFIVCLLFLCASQDNSRPV